MLNKEFNKLLISVFFLIYFIFGLFVYKDYGIGIEEHFQRQNGFYWLKNILSLLNLQGLEILASDKYQEIRLYDSNLPNSEFFNFYGIFFDTTTAFIELIFKIESSKLYFEIRHLFNFSIFFISSIFFYKILKNRFKHTIIVFFGTLFYIFSPRIYGDSFHNNKDVLFLSLLTISLFFLFKYFEKDKIKNIILFCLFAAIATSSRIMGIYLPLLLILFLFVEYLSKKISLRNFINKKLIISFFFIFFLYLHYPYMWELNIFKFSEWFKVYFYNMGLRILFDGNYYHIKYLPRFYLPVWISITTPIYILILFLGGYFLMFRRFFQRILNMKKIIVCNDLWRSVNEKKDLFIFISLSIFFLYAVFLNVAMLSGWRHFYFLHIYITYISIYMMNIALNLFIRKKIHIIYFNLINFLFIFLIITQIYIFHPYQSLFFNSFINEKNIKRFPVDTPSLSRSDALKEIVQLHTGSKKIFVANASWTPFYNGKDMLNKQDQDKFVFVGQDYDKADYIYTSFNYEVDPNFNKKYNIPEQFKEIKKMQIKNIPIYSIYKRIK